MENTGILDSTGKSIIKGDVFIHNGKKFYIKYSENQKVLLAKVCNDTGQNWRSLDWLNNVRKYITVIGNIYETKTEL